MLKPHAILNLKHIRLVIFLSSINSMNIGSLFNKYLLNIQNILSCIHDPRNTKSNKILLLPSSGLCLKQRIKVHRHQNDGVKSRCRNPEKINTLVQMSSVLSHELPYLTSYPFLYYTSFLGNLIHPLLHHLYVQMTQLFSLLLGPFSGLQTYVFTYLYLHIHSICNYVNM